MSRDLFRVRVRSSQSNMGADDVVEWSTGQPLSFDPKSFSCTLVVEPTHNEAVTSGLEDDAVRMEVELRVTHPEFLSSTPRDGAVTLRRHASDASDKTPPLEFVLTLSNLEAIDTKALQQTPMRVMLLATLRRGDEIVLGSQKMKLMCSNTSVEVCCGSFRPAREGVPAAIRSQPAENPPPSSLVAVSRTLPALAVAAPPQQSSPASKFTLRFTLHRLSVPRSFMRGSPEFLLCAQWKRLSVTGTSPWFSMSMTSETGSTVSASLKDFVIVLPDCDVAVGLKRSIFTVGFVGGPRSGDATVEFLPELLGTLKIDTSGFLPEEIQRKPTDWPVQLGGQPCTLEATVITSERDDFVDGLHQEDTEKLAMGRIAPFSSDTHMAEQSTSLTTPLRSGASRSIDARPEDVPSTPSAAADVTGARLDESIVSSTGMGGGSLIDSFTTGNSAAAAAAQGATPRGRHDTLRSHLENLRTAPIPAIAQAPLSGAASAGALSSAGTLATVGATAVSFGAKGGDTSFMPMELSGGVGGAGGGAAATNSNPLRSFERQMPKSSNVMVAVRIRPLLSFEAPSSNSPWSYTDTTISFEGNSQTYTYDAVFPPQTRNAELFDRLCPPFVDNALLGINGTIFMYGQTASGKTHTMFGSETEAGLTPLVIRALFTEADRRRRESEDGSSLSISVTASYFEIYNEELNDLLDISRKNLVVRSTGGVDGGFAVDVCQVPVSSADEAMQVLMHGSYNKKMGQSHLNDRSSRSHSIFKLQIEVTSGTAISSPVDGAKYARSGSSKSSISAANKQATGSSGPQLSAELCLVDLAGSETLQERGGSTQRKETTNINLSLTYLKKVIWELAHKEKHVSYRNSSLTKVLKQAIGGNSRTCVICCMTPAEEHARDSRNTLVFGTTAKTVVTTTRANVSGVVPAAAEAERLRREVAQLKAQIEAYEATIQAYSQIQGDLKNVLDENETMADQLDKVTTENTQLREFHQQLQHQLQQAQEEIRRLPTVSEVPVNATAIDESQTTAPQLHLDPLSELLSLEPPPPQQQRAASVERIASTLRAAADEHAAQLEKAINLLNDANEAAAVTADDNSRRSLSTTPITPSANDDGEESRRKPAPPLKRPPTNPKLADRRTVESLQLQLIEQTVEHRNAMLQKDEEIRKILEQQMRPTDEIPEILRKEEKVCVLLDQLHTFLHHGTSLALLFPPDASWAASVEACSSTIKAPTVKPQPPLPRIGQVFMYLYTSSVTKETHLCFCLTEDHDTKLPKRSSCFEKIAVKDIKRIELGQFSDAFEKLKHKVTTDLENQHDLDSPYHQTARRLVERRRMSFTVVGRKSRTIDCVCEDEADFEAWVIEFNRLLGQSAEWKQPLDISRMEFYEALSAEERTFCGTMHIHPDEYLRAKSKLLKRREKFVTLFDVRSLAQFDLYHSQRFFYFLRCQGWVAQAAFFYITDAFANAAHVDLESL